MIDLTKEQFIFRPQSITEICDQLKAEFPNNVNMFLKDGKQPQIKISDGLWRGASLIIDNSSNQLRLAGIYYYIPRFLAKVIIAITSVAVFSIIMMVLLSIFTGEFVPAVAGIGGAAGFAMYSIIQMIFIANIKSSWSPKLHPVVEKLRLNPNENYSVDSMGNDTKLYSTANESSTGDRIIYIAVIWIFFSRLFWTVVPRLIDDMHYTEWFKILNGIMVGIWAFVPIGLAFAVKDNAKQVILFIIGGLYLLYGLYEAGMIFTR